MKPIVCNKNPIVSIPFGAKDCDYWLVTTTDLQSVDKPSRDNAYLLPNGDFYVYNGNKFVHVNDHSNLKVKWGNVIGDINNQKDLQTLFQEVNKKIDTNKKGVEQNSKKITSLETRADNLEKKDQDLQTQIEGIDYVKSISRNGTLLNKDQERNVDIDVPENVSDLSNDLGFITPEYLDRNSYVKNITRNGAFLPNNDGTVDIQVPDKLSQIHDDIGLANSPNWTFLEAVTIDFNKVDKTFLTKKAPMCTELLVEYYVNDRMVETETVQIDGSKPGTRTLRKGLMFSTDDGTKYPIDTSIDFGVISVVTRYEVAVSVDNKLTNTEAITSLVNKLEMKFYYRKRESADQLAEYSKLKEQVKTNTTDVTQLKQDLPKLAIKDKASGNPVIINDSADWQMQGLNIYGQSEQVQTNPSPEYPQEIVSKEVSKIKVTGKNLINVSNESVSDKYTNNNYTIKDGGVLFLTANTWGGDFIYFNKIDTSEIKELTFELENFSELAPVNTQGVKFIIRAYNKKGEAIQNEVIINTCSYGLVWNDHYNGYVCTKGYTNPMTAQFKNDVDSIAVGITYQNGKVGSQVDVRKIQVRYGNSSTPYEPYKEQLVTLSSPITLRGIPVSSGGNVMIDGKQYVSDVIEEKGGVVGIEKKCGYIENYIDENVGDTYISTTGELSQGASVLYKLEVPTFEPLPLEDQQAIKALKSYYPNTVIQTDCLNECEYVADPKLYIDKLIAKYHATTQANQLAMMSLLPDETQATMIEKDQQNLLGGI